MQIRIKSPTSPSSSLRELAQRRVRFVMRRLVWLVPEATVQLVDVNGPRGGVDKRCRVTLQPVGLPPVVVTSTATEWRTALDQALARAARALLRQWRRSQSSPHDLRLSRSVAG